MRVGPLSLDGMSTTCVFDDVLRRFMQTGHVQLLYDVPTYTNDMEPPIIMRFQRDKRKQIVCFYDAFLPLDMHTLCGVDATVCATRTSDSLCRLPVQRNDVDLMLFEGWRMCVNHVLSFTCA